MLLVVGATDQALIRRHRRLQAFDPEDYELLVELLGNYPQVLVTPNTLTETSNLLSQHAEPQRSRFFDTFRSLIEINKEIVVASLEASGNASFKRLGLTDAALLEVVTPDTPLITVDPGLIRGSPGKGARRSHQLHAPPAPLVAPSFRRGGSVTRPSSGRDLLAGHPASSVGAAFPTGLFRSTHHPSPVRGEPARSPRRGRVEPPPDAATNLLGQSANLHPLLRPLQIALRPQRRRRLIPSPWQGV